MSAQSGGRFINVSRLQANLIKMNQFRGDKKIERELREIDKARLEVLPPHILWTNEMTQTNSAPIMDITLLCRKALKERKV